MRPRAGAVSSRQNFSLYTDDIFAGSKFTHGKVIIQLCLTSRCSLQRWDRLSTNSRVAWLAIILFTSRKFSCCYVNFLPEQRNANVKDLCIFIQTNNKNKTWLLMVSVLTPWREVKSTLVWLIESQLLTNVHFFLNINTSFSNIKLNRNCKINILVSEGFEMNFGICKYKPAAIWYVLHITTVELPCSSWCDTVNKIHRWTALRILH